MDNNTRKRGSAQQAETLGRDLLPLPRPGPFLAPPRRDAIPQQAETRGRLALPRERVKLGRHRPAMGGGGALETLNRFAHLQEKESVSA